MPLNSSIVGSAGEYLVSEVDARWTMAYAAGLGDVPVKFEIGAPHPETDEIFMNQDLGEFSAGN